MHDCQEGKSSSDGFSSCDYDMMMTNEHGCFREFGLMFCYAIKT